MSSTIVIFWTTLIVVHFGLALPMVIGRSWWRIVPGMLLVFAGVTLPLFFFFFSAFLVPEWKGACQLGWVNCFHLGKIALAPLVLFATGALYRREICRASDRWLVHGFVLGALVSSVCFLFGVASISLQDGFWLLIVPLYIAIWYSVRMVQLVKSAQLDAASYLKLILGSLPFWIVSVLWSKSVYLALPNKAPTDCFVVTAATHGHGKFVGPFLEIERNGRRLQANQQLLTLWRFENIWRHHAPRSHRNFRRCYNRFGPVIAAQIKSPWLADLAFITLKPVELVAKLINHHARKEP